MNFLQGRWPKWSRDLVSLLLHPQMVLPPTRGSAPKHPTPPESGASSCSLVLCFATRSGHYSPPRVHLPTSTHLTGGRTTLIQEGKGLIQGNIRVGKRADVSRLPAWCFSGQLDDFLLCGPNTQPYQVLALLVFLVLVNSANIPLGARARSHIRHLPF